MLGSAALEELQNALAAGKIEGHGLPDYAERPIPASKWRYLKHRIGSHGRDTFAIEGEQIIEQVTFSSAEILGLWPGYSSADDKNSDDVEIAVRNPQGAEDYLLGVERLFLADRGPRMKQREWQTYAKRNYGIGQATANAIWGKTSKGFRQGPGRPKS